MSVACDGATQWLHIAQVPTGDWSVVAWMRLDTDDGAAEILFALDDVFGTASAGKVDMLNTNALQLRSADGGNSNLGASMAVGTWTAFLMTYQAESTGGADDGVLTLKGTVTGSADSFLASVQQTALTNQSPTDVTICAEQRDGGGAGGPFHGTCALFKVFNAVLTDQQALNELKYRNPQETAWASWAFRTGALTTDDSGNSRTLTNVGTATFSSDEPTEILGDDPTGSILPMVNAAIYG